MFGEFFQKKVKETDVLNPKFKVPEKYYPEWYNRGLTPIEIDEERLRETMTDNNPKQRFPASIIDDDEAPKIKPAAIMQNPKDTAWYDEMDTEIPPSKIIDNNDVVDNDKLQKHEVKMSANDELIDIRAKLLEKQKPKKETPATAAPGEFVVMVKGKAAHIGDLETTKKACEELIVADETLTADDFMVFLRVPLSKIITD